MAARLLVRPAVPADGPGVYALYASDPEDDRPFSGPADAVIHLNHRILEDFLIDVAVAGRRVVAQSEWILSDEPAPVGRHLYLGMLQTHPDHRGLGAGRALIERGLERAAGLGCPVVRTIASHEAKGFYRKCGFARSGRVVEAEVPIGPAEWPAGWRRVRSVPRRVVGELPFRLGWAQACSAHMWSMANRPIPRAAEPPLRCPAARSPSGDAFVQLRYGMAQAWAEPAVPLEALIAVARALAVGRPWKRLLFMAPERERAALSAALGRPARSAADLEIWTRPVP